MFELYLLRKRKYRPAVTTRFNIFYSTVFKQYASFSRAIAILYPSAVITKIEFGDLLLNPAYRKLFHG